MLAVSNDFIPGKKITKVMGLVLGSAVTSQGLSNDFIAAFKSFKGGEIEAYTKLLNDARVLAYDRMVAQAEEMDADGIISVQFVSSSLMPGAAEILVYGTAIKMEEVEHE